MSLNAGKTISLLILALTLPCWAVTEVVRYVDPDATGAANGTSWTDAYTALVTGYTTEAKDITATDEQFTFYCRSSAGTSDTTQANLDGFTTDATRYVKVVGFDFPADGIYDSTKYELHVTNPATAAFFILDDYTRIQNLQIVVTTTGGTDICVRLQSLTGGTITTIDSCIIKGNCSGTGLSYGIQNFAVATTMRVFNTTITGFVSGADNDFYGIYGGVGVTEVNNVTVWNCRTGIYGVAANWAQNCIVGNCNDDFSIPNIKYCLSNDGDGTNAQTPASSDWDNELVDANNGNFTLKAGSKAIGNGVDNPTGGLYLDDIIGTTRTSTWDIGAFEAASASGQIMWLKLED